MIDMDRDIDSGDYRRDRDHDESEGRRRTSAGRDEDRALSNSDRVARHLETQERPGSGGAKETSHRAESDREMRRRHPGRAGRQVYRTSEDERRLLYELGRFRTISVTDLKDLRYAGDSARMRQDVHALTSQGLIRLKQVWTGRHRKKESFLALTQSGKRLARRNPDLPKGQVLYAGFCKPAELRHDAAIYRMYEHEARRIAREGGQVKRVILDYELKRKAYSPLAKARLLSNGEYSRRQAEIAREHGLKVVNGHIALPDLRIEYQTVSGASAEIDLEVASESYHGSHAAEKAAAGFTIYASPDTANRLQAALEEREITADILYL
jgi:hypothetical protein